MIKSMTGYGKAGLQTGETKCDLEIKSVNHRFCEISIQNIPQDLRFLEPKIRKTISTRFSRGHFYLNFHIALLNEETGPGPCLNVDLARKYYSALMELKKNLRIPEEITLFHLLEFSDKFFMKSHAPDYTIIRENMGVLLDQAMADLENMRKEEGASLAKTLMVHLNCLKNKLKEIDESREGIIQNYKKRLLKKINELKTAAEADPQRIAQEVVLFSDRMDIQEEIARLNSHLEQFSILIQKEEPAGKGLDFLVQEMNREVNTIVSKMGGSPACLFMKQELEILREQVQNIE